MPAELALVVPFPELAEQVGVVDGLPPHVTVLYPCPDDAGAIGEVLEPFEAFAVSFPRLDRFPGFLWLAPEPAERFTAMIEALVTRFPDWPPYGGIHDSVVPHLTVAQDDFDETAARLEPLLPLQSRAEAAVLYERASDDHWAEVQSFQL